MFRTFAEIWVAYKESRQAWRPQQAQLGRDRRQFYRVPIRVACRTSNRTYGQEMEATLVNLSLGGAGFLAPAKWPEGSRVRIVIDTLRFETNAVTVFRGDGASDFLYGVKFERMGIRNIVKLRRILRQHYQGSLTL
jgi:c-di-GMP-binding flagellar brake protein YcgR